MGIGLIPSLFSSTEKYFEKHNQQKTPRKYCVAEVPLFSLFFQTYFNSSCTSIIIIFLFSLCLMLCDYKKSIPQGNIFQTTQTCWQPELFVSFDFQKSIGCVSESLFTGQYQCSLTHIFTIIGQKTVPAITTTWDCSIDRYLAVKDFDSFRGLNCLFFLDSKPVKIPGKLPPPDLPGSRFTLILL